MQCPDLLEGLLHAYEGAHLQTCACPSTGGRMETPALAPPSKPPPTPWCVEEH